ncbi:MAG: hypothetical protein H0T62_05290 [Parachlamydiaceae bacterium]|nr:hypothetical protein [Parachlamydiaceae bacterium]
MINQVSPFSSFTNFFKPVYSDMDASYQHEGETFSCLRESINLFDFGQNAYTLLTEVEDDALVLVEREGSTQSLSEIAIRIAKIATIIIPFVHLVGAAIYFLTNDFQLQASEHTEDIEDTDNAFKEHTFIQIEKTTTPDLDMFSDIEDIDHALGVYTFIEIEKTNTPVFDMLSDDLIELFFKYLGPACFQLASTDKRAFKLMNADLSLESYRVGREILKKCFVLEASENIQVEKSFPLKLLKCLCAFDLAAALERANSNENLKLKVRNLSFVSNAYAKFDKIKALEILEQAYSDISFVGRLDRPLSGVGDKEKKERFDELAALTSLAKDFIKYDLEKARKIIEKIQQDYPTKESCKEAIRECLEMQLFLSLDLLKCQEAETMKLEKENIYSTINLIGKLFGVFPKKANFLIDDLLEFMNKFVQKFPETDEGRVFFLVKLCGIVAPFDKSRLRELAALAMKEAESLNLEKYLEFYLRATRGLVEWNLMEANIATKRALELMQFIEKSELHNIHYVVRLSLVTFSFNNLLSEELLEKALVKIYEKWSRVSKTPLEFYIRPDADLLMDLIGETCDVILSTTLAYKILALHDPEKASEMLNLVLKMLENTTPLIDASGKLFGENCTKNLFMTMQKSIFNILKLHSERNFIRAKNEAEKLENPYMRLIALTSVVEGILSIKNLEVDMC